MNGMERMFGVLRGHIMEIQNEVNYTFKLTKKEKSGNPIWRYL